MHRYATRLCSQGYSIAAARVGVVHKLLDTLQLEPSSQFGVRTKDAGGKYTHFVLHFTFAHQFSLEGVPMIDTTHGE